MVDSCSFYSQESFEQPPKEPEDDESIEVELDVNDEEAEEEFEKLWARYIRKTSLDPLGGVKIQELQKQIEDIRDAKEKVQAELQQQLDFFESSKTNMEARYAQSTSTVSHDQEQTMEDLSNILASITISSRKFDANGPWELFSESLDDAVQQSEVKPMPGDGFSIIANNTHAVKPSARAMYLNNAYEENISSRVTSRDFMRRAYKIDQALLQAQLKTLQREVERVESTTVSLDFLGKVLTEHDVRGLLSNSVVGNSATVTSRSRATKASRAPSRIAVTE